jgi:hypothetical protein
MVINHQRRTHLHRQPKPDRHFNPPLGWSPLKMTVTIRSVPDPAWASISESSPDAPSAWLGDSLPEEMM